MFLLAWKCHHDDDALESSVFSSGTVSCAQVERMPSSLPICNVTLGHCTLNQLAHSSWACIMWTKVGSSCASGSPEVLMETSSLGSTFSPFLRAQLPVCRSYAECKPPRQTWDCPNSFLLSAHVLLPFSTKSLMQSDFRGSTPPVCQTSSRSLHPPSRRAESLKAELQLQLSLQNISYTFTTLCLSTCSSHL